MKALDGWIFFQYPNFISLASQQLHSNLVQKGPQIPWRILRELWGALGELWGSYGGGKGLISRISKSREEGGGKSGMRDGSWRKEERIGYNLQKERRRRRKIKKNRKNQRWKGIAKGCVEFDIPYSSSSSCCGCSWSSSIALYWRRKKQSIWYVLWDHSQ